MKSLLILLGILSTIYSTSSNLVFAFDSGRDVVREVNPHELEETPVLENLSYLVEKNYIAIDELTDEMIIDMEDFYFEVETATSLNAPSNGEELLKKMKKDLKDGKVIWLVLKICDENRYHAITLIDVKPDRWNVYSGKILTVINSWGEGERKIKWDFRTNKITGWKNHHGDEIFCSVSDVRAF
ncbi:MAG: hypothetical protein HN576_01115 [Bacteriovoracaceae bacterium]|jgi:hypothetical protein|nr:hypothetical protein [Bacteriovoracaceae bacterium]